MGGSKKDITIKISAKEVSAIHFSEVLRSIQGIVTNIGNVLAQRRKREETRLVIKDVELGSATVTLSLFSPQTDLDTLLPFGEKVIDRTRKVFQNLNRQPDKEFLSNAIPDEYRRRNVLKKCYNLWSQKKEIESVSIAFGDESLQKLNSQNSVKIRSLITPEVIKKETYIGRIMGININRKEIMIDADKGQIKGKYLHTLEKKMGNLLGVFVRVSTMAKENRFIDEIRDPTIFKPLNTYPLKKLMFKGEMIELRHPLELSVEFIDEEKLYILKNSEFDIFTVANTLNEGINTFCDQLESLWEVYVGDTSMELTEDALELKAKLKKYVGR